jgi:hypothetical protein
MASATRVKSMPFFKKRFLLLIPKLWRKKAPPFRLFRIFLLLYETEAAFYESEAFLFRRKRKKRRVPLGQKRGSGTFLYFD